MKGEQFQINRRILIIDDSQPIHDDIGKVLGKKPCTADLDALEADLFDEPEDTQSQVVYELSSAYQGEAGFQLVKEAAAAKQPYAMAFVDMRMPPGWDGLKTIEHLWQVDPDLQVVICSAYSDHSWTELMERLGQSDRLLILKKPFDPVEVAQLAHTLTHKWSIQRRVAEHLEQLDSQVERRTRDLATAHERLKSEVAQREQMEEELRLAQKLESVGQLAAGIAHEINTPVQFIGDSVHFLKDAFGDLTSLVKAYQTSVASLESDPANDSLIKDVRQAEQEADLEYLDEQLPKACDRALKGIERVGDIVRAMKEFSHPDQREKTPMDVTRMLENALMVSKNEYKYVAKVSTEFSDVPALLCHPGELGQVFLNLIVNAAHAITDHLGDDGSQGHIELTSLQQENEVVVKVRDNGGGIPEEITHRVFDQFFTTKTVGRGTGQGLAMARRIVEKHAGRITFDSQPGEGTTFTVRIPLTHPDIAEAQVA